MSDLTMVVDGGILYRFFKADPRWCASNFLRCIQACQRRYEPDSLIVAFDAGHAGRSEIDPGYKADREEKPIEYRRAVNKVKAEMPDGTINVEADGYEADDCIASLAHAAVELEHRVVIVSPDKDLRQCLVDGKVTIGRKIERRGNPISEWITAAHLTEEYGFGPERWVDYQCLVGDSADGIKGVPDIGDKTAREILRLYSLDEAIDNADSLPISLARRANLKVSRELIEKNRKIFTLKTDLRLMEGIQSATL